jgi:hypothetical protein
MISRKRELERAILAAFTDFAGTALTGVNTYNSRQRHAQADAFVMITCPRQSPLEGMDEIATRMTVEGAIVCSALVTNQAATAIEALEIQAENFIEQKTSDLLADINAETSAIEVTDIQPGECEDGYDEEGKRYLSRYSFTAYVIDLAPYPENQPPPD